MTREVLIDVLLEFTIYISILLILGNLIVYWLDNRKKVKDVNGVKLGDTFKLVCEVDDNVSIYLDTETKFLYLLSEGSITPLLDKNGKIKKYKEFIETLGNKE
jgi:hypothetical protein